MNDRRAIIIDTDPGNDDAVALWLALACSDRLDIRAVTAVAGNVSLVLTERNARAIVGIAGRLDIPVHAGCAAPWLRPLITEERIHGASGMDGADLPPPTQPLAEGHAVDAIIDIVMGAPEKTITLCPLGPLTNIATAFVREPRIVPRLREIVLMGGAIGLGNMTPSAEFNIHADPHAADAVFRAGAPIVMIPLDATHQVLGDAAWVQRMRALGTRTGKAIAGMLARGLQRDLSRFGERGAPLHDPCVIAYLLWPELFQGTHCAVAIETMSELTMGRTVVDRWRRTAARPNALVIERIDASPLFARMAEALARLP